MIVHERITMRAQRGTCSTVREDSARAGSWMRGGHGTAKGLPLALLAFLLFYACLSSAFICASGQWAGSFPMGAPPVQYSSDVIQGVYQVASTYWETFLMGIGMYEPSHGSGKGTDESLPSVDTEESKSKDARLQVIKFLWKLKQSNRDGDEGDEEEDASAQAIAYDYDDIEDFDESERKQQRDAFDFLYNKVMNLSNIENETMLESWIIEDEDKSGKLKEYVTTAIQSFPDDVWDDIASRLNSSTLDKSVIEEVLNSLHMIESSKGNYSTRSYEEGEEASELNLKINASTSDSNEADSVDAIKDKECLLSELIVEDNSCLGMSQGAEQDICVISLMNEAIKRSDWMQNITSNSFNILFMPSDSAILRMLKFAEVSPKLALNEDTLMTALVKRHLLMYDAAMLGQKALTKLGLEKLLLSEDKPRYTILELPRGMLANSPDYFMILRMDGGGDTSLFFTTELPPCNYSQIVVPEVEAQLFNPVDDKCMTQHLTVCLDPNYHSSVTEGTDFGHIDNPCGIAELLDVKVCSDGIVFPINDLLLNTLDSANFLTLLASLDVDTTQRPRPEYEWFLTMPPPVINTGTMNDSDAFAIGKVKRESGYSGIYFHGENFVYIPGVQLEGDAISICFSIVPEDVSGIHVIFAMNSRDKSISIRTIEIEGVNYLQLEVNSNVYNSSLVIQGGVQTNIAIVYDPYSKSWDFYEDSWYIDGTDSFGPLTSMTSPAFIGRPAKMALSTDEENQYWIGLIKDLKIFVNKALGPDDLMHCCDEEAPELDSIVRDNTNNTAEYLYFKTIEELNVLLSDDKLQQESLVRSKLTDESSQFGDSSGNVTVEERDLCFQEIVNDAKLYEGLDNKSKVASGEAEYYYKMTADGANSGKYKFLNEDVINVGGVPFSSRGAHFDGRTQFLVIPNIALIGFNATIGFTFSVDNFERLHQTLFQLISQCDDYPLNLIVRLKLNSQFTGNDHDYLQLYVNKEVTNIKVEGLQTRKPLSFAVVFEGSKWRIYVRKNEASTLKNRAVLPHLLGRARVGSEKSFAGFIKDLFIYDRALSPLEIQNL